MPFVCASATPNGKDHDPDDRHQGSAPIGRLSAELRSACRRGETDAFGETAFRLSRGGTAFHRVSPGQTLLSEDTSCGSHQARPFSRPRSAFGETSFRLSQRWNCVPPDPARSHNSLLHHVPSTRPRHPPGIGRGQILLLAAPCLAAPGATASAFCCAKRLPSQTPVVGGFRRKLRFRLSPTSPAPPDWWR